MRDANCDCDCDCDCDWCRPRVPLPSKADHFTAPDTIVEDVGGSTGFGYLACPYSSSDPDARKYRAESATAAATLLFHHGLVVFSPITQSHAMVEEDSSLPGDFTGWRDWDYAFLSRASYLVVLCLPGWRTSVGVAAEIKYARMLGLPVFYMP
jgi:hypothetical protein